jgi:hypothetical protein
VFIVSIALFLAAILLFAGSASSLVMAQQTTTGPGTTTTPLIPPSSVTTGQATTSIPTSPPLTPQEQEQQTRLQSVIAATNQNLEEAEKQVGGIVYTPRWSDPVWVEPDSAAVLVAYCLPGEFAESGQEILGGFELEVLESYEVALPQNFTAWMMVIGNEDRQDRIPAAVGVVCASDANDAQTRIVSPEEQQQINNVVQQFTTIQNRQITSIDQVINIINNNATTNQNATGGGGTTPPPAGGTDTTAPTLTVPQNFQMNTTDPDGDTVLYDVSAQDDVDGTATLSEGSTMIQDNVGGNITISCIPPSESTFSVGDTTVQCSATDAAGNPGTASFIISVRGPPSTTSPAGSTDTIAPSLSVPVDRVVPTTPNAPDGYLLLYDVTAADNVDGTATLDDNGVLIQGDNVGGNITISCNPPPAPQFFLPVGDHTVQCSATDAAGNPGTASFTVTVTPPPTTPVGPAPRAAITASVSSNPPTYEGPCPVAIEFSGTITDNVGNRDVSYRFIDSARSTGLTKVIQFNQPASQSVSITLTLGGDPRYLSYQGWVAIEILEPIQLQSNQAEYEIICLPPPDPTDVEQEQETAPAPTDEEEDTTTDEEGAGGGAGGGGDGTGGGAPAATTPTDEGAAEGEAATP